MRSNERLRVQPSQPGQTRRAEPAKTIPQRNKLRIAFGLIIFVGLIGALLVGGGKHVKFHPVVDSALLSASLDGKPVHIGGSWIAMIERRASTAPSADRAPPKK